MKAIAFIAAALLHASAVIADGVEAQCSPIISYVPVTYTVTETVTPVVEQSVAATTNVPLTSTSTHYFTVTLSLATPSNTIDTATTAVYSYIVESGTTSWFGSIAPSSGQSLVTVTSTVFVYPSYTEPASPTLPTLTVVPPPYETTSFGAPDESTITITTTRTRTTTISTVVTNTRSSFTPIGSAGWNSTADGPSFLPEGTGVSIISGSPTTITGTVYLSTGTHITSTSYYTSTLTLTLSTRKTLTVTPPDGTLTITDVVPTSLILSELTTPSASSTAVGPVGSSSQVTGVVPDSYGPGPVVSLTISGSISDSSTASSLQLMSGRQPSSGVISGSGQHSTPSTASATSATGTLPASTASASPSQVPSASSLRSAASQSTSASTSEAISSGLTASTIVSQSLASTRGSSLTASASADTASLPNISGSAAVNSIPQLSGPAGYGSPSPASASSAVTVLPQSASSLASDISASPSSLFTSIVSGRSSASSSVVSISTILPSMNSAVSSSIVVQSGPSSIAVLSPPAGYGSPTTLSVQISTIASSTSSVASPTPSVCGEHGDFVLNFDDLPTFSTNDNNTDITQAPPIFNGYHHLAFSNGYVYAPPPRDPFPPHSPPHLAVFLGNASGSGVNNTPTAMAPISGMIRPGEFGDGISDSVSAFWFNAYSAWLGCDNSGPEVCTYVLTAYAWNPTVEQELQVATTNVTTSPCPGFQNCQLEQVTFPGSFSGLSGLQIQAYKGPDQVMFFMDDVSMGWYNNTCAAGLQRLRSQRGGTPAKR